jgi:hypothetical protein
VAAIGDSNDGGTIAMVDGGCITMDGRMAAQSRCAASQSRWTVAEAMGDCVETAVIDNGGDSAMDGGMAAQLR